MLTHSLIIYFCFQTHLEIRFDARLWSQQQKQGPKNVPHRCPAVQSPKAQATPTNADRNIAHTRSAVGYRREPSVSSESSAGVDYKHGFEQAEKWIHNIPAPIKQQPYVSPYALKLKKVSATSTNINHKAFFGKVEVKNDTENIGSTTAGK